MPCLALDKATRFSKGPRLARRVCSTSSIVAVSSSSYRCLLEPGVDRLARACLPRLFLGGGPGRPVAHLNARDTTLGFARGAPRSRTSSGVKARMGWENCPCYIHAPTTPLVLFFFFFDTDFSACDEWQRHERFSAMMTSLPCTYVSSEHQHLGDEAIGTRGAYSNPLPDCARRQDHFGGLAVGLNPPYPRHTKGVDWHRRYSASRRPPGDGSHRSQQRRSGTQRAATRWRFVRVAPYVASRHCREKRIGGPAPRHKPSRVHCTCKP